MASRYDHLIDRLFKDDDSRRIARAAVDQFSAVPGMDRYIEGSLQEFARVNDLVGTGAKTADEGRELLLSTVDALGVPPHLTGAITSWYDATSQTEATAETEQADDAEASRSPATADQAQPAPPAQAQPPAPAPSAAPAQPARPSPAELQQEIEKWEGAMRSQEGSPEWRSYWRGPGQQSYLNALRLREWPPSPRSRAAPQRQPRSRHDGSGTCRSLPRRASPA